MSPEVIRNFVDGARVDAVSGSTTEIIDPSTGQAYATAPDSGPEDIDGAMRAAERAFQQWRRTTPAQRQLALNRIADAIEQRQQEFIQLEARNCGKPPALTESEDIPMMLEQIRFFAGAARMLDGKSAGEYMEGFTSWVRREPVGVAGQITPWNYPMMMAVWKWAPAIAAGNTVVLKPAATTPASTVAMAELMNEFLPSGVFNVVCGGRETGRGVVEHPVPAIVSITGSVAAGKQVAASAANQLKRVHLELGGKAPVCVFDDADVPAAAAAIAEAGYFNAGQDCTSATRVLVQQGVHDEFVAELTRIAGETVTGGPETSDVLYGPLNSAEQLEKVSGMVQRAPAHARVHTGGARVGDAGYFYAPTVISGLQQDDEMVQDEIFGPVITVQSFVTEQDALRMANDSRYGLASSVWTTDHARALRTSRELDFGCVWVNCHIPLVGEMPHGGFKESGYGKDLSAYSLEDYTRVKHVMSSLEG